MEKDYYKRALEAAQDELEELVSKREEIDNRIAQVNESIVALARLAKEIPSGTYFDELMEMGLTDAIREVLRRAHHALSPLQVKETLRKMGYDLSKHKNVLPSIHTVLKRLIDADEVKSRVNQDGKRVYWQKNKEIMQVTKISPTESKITHIPIEKVKTK